MDCRREVFRKLRLALAYYIKLGQELCFHNGGIYIKLGQHIVQLEYVLPQEYVQTMRESMLKRCPVSSYEDVQGVFKKEIGELPETVFAEFNPVPLASASLVQVHAATTHDGKKVAVKVQHDHLLDTSVIDIATVDLVVNALNYIFPTFDYRFRYADGLPLERYSP